MPKTKEKEKDFQQVANEYGQRVMAGLKDMVDALQHAQTECEGCTRGQGCDNAEAWHDEDAARTAIQEDPLSVQLRSGWYSPGDKPTAEEFEILLGTGGPAVRIIGELNGYQQPQSAQLQYQDWFKPWTTVETTPEQDRVLLAYASEFYYES